MDTENTLSKSRINWRKKDPRGSLLSCAKERAKRKNIPLTISKEDIIIPFNCPALGIPIQSRLSNFEGNPSLDRINYKRGYVQGNIQVLSQKANAIKYTATGWEILKVGWFVWKQELWNKIKAAMNGQLEEPLEVQSNTYNP